MAGCLRRGKESWKSKQSWWNSIELNEINRCALEGPPAHNPAKQRNQASPHQLRSLHERGFIDWLPFTYRAVADGLVPRLLVVFSFRFFSFFHSSFQKEEGRSRRKETNCALSSMVDEIDWVCLFALAEPLTHFSSRSGAPPANQTQSSSINRAAVGLQPSFHSWIQSTSFKFSWSIQEFHSAGRPQCSSTFTIQSQFPFSKRIVKWIVELLSERGRSQIKII